MFTLLAAVLMGCPTPEPTYEAPPVLEGAPVAGAAEGTLDLPVGTPLGGYSSRCGCLASTSAPDLRTSPYSESFVESAGVQARPTIKVVWLENGSENLVIVKADVIYAFDGLVVEITRQLEAATGLDLDGRVIFTANHTHHSYGPFSDQFHFYLGGDKFNQEIFERFAAEAVEVAMEAFEEKEPVAIGTAWFKDWDPNDQIYRDRRGENNELAVWPDAEPGYGKDPYLNMIRIDRLDGSPLAAVFTFGIHGIILSEENSLLSPDSAGHIELALQETWDEEVVVMHLQGSGGDASPAGRDRRYARLENLGERAAPVIKALWEQTPTDTLDIRMETASRHIWQFHSDIQVTRTGDVDWRYADLVPVEDADPDLEIYDSEGNILSPLDEFNAPYGAAFCGNGDFDIPVGKIGADVFPYDACMDVELMGGLISAFFDIEELPLPMPESFKAGTTITRFGPLTTRMPDGEVIEHDVFGGFFPAEPTAMYGEQWRRRVESELGHEMAWLVGYAQDHEGYFLIPEDWLVGGYEPNIALWGPLQGEHVMEGMLEYGDAVLNTDVREDPDPYGWYGPTEYLTRDLPTRYQPDIEADIGTLITEPPVEQDDDEEISLLWLPEEFTLDLSVDQVERLQDSVQIAWIGGDPMVDLPTVTLEFEGEDGWEAVRTPSGRPITDAMPDIITTHRPHPLWPSTDDQTHRWWAVWQAVGPYGSRTSLPAGNYRLVVDGHNYAGGDETWPWSTTEYQVIGESFSLVPTGFASEATDDGFWLWFEGPSDGFRMIDVDGESRGNNPVRGTVTFTTDAGDVQAEPVEIAGGRARYVVSGNVTNITDAAGNYAIAFD